LKEIDITKKVNSVYKKIGSVDKITISNCPKLTKITIKKIDCKELILKNIPQLKSLDVGDNQIKELNLEEQKELVNFNIENNPLKKPLFSSQKTENYSIDTGTRKVLLVGSTGSGKSTLANILSESNDFEESGSRISQTKEIKAKEFEIEISNKYFKNEKIRYKIIDTPGI
jgi:ABC-type glutathione transport system ATPase component